MDMGYLIRHEQAWVNPRGFERPIRDMLIAISSYIALSEEEYGEDGLWRDYVLGPAVGDMLLGLQELLNGPIGRFDAGTLDDDIRKLAERIDYI